MGSGGDRLGSTETGTDAPVEPPKAGIAVGDGLCGHTQGIGCAVRGLPCFCAFDLTSGDPVIGAESELGDETLFRGELSMVETNFGENSLHGDDVETGYLGEIYSTYPVEFGPEVDEGLVTHLLLPLLFRERVLYRVDLRLEGVEVALDLPITRFYLAVIKVIELNCLLQGEEMFLPVVALEGLGDSLGSILNPALSQEGELFGLSFPGYNCPDDVHACHSGNV